MTSLNPQNFEYQLVSVKKSLDTAQTKITFWGNRIVSLPGSNESVPLEALASKVLTAGSHRNLTENFTPEERVAGIELVKKLQNLYIITDKQVRQRNILTRIFNLIREFHFFYHCHPFTTRFLLFGCGQEETGHYNFKVFTRSSFFRQFGEEHLRGERHPATYQDIEPNDLTINAKEEAIRALIR